MPMPLLCCPVCRAPLVIDASGASARCEAGHSFDRARQGYWNLLLAQRKRSKDPGDSNEMILARRRFLDGGYYRPISDQLNRMLLERTAGLAEPAILDLGCGEGYYTAALEQALLQAGRAPALAGLDISKHAVRHACPRSHSIAWLVATGAAIPLPAQSLDAIVLVFSRVMAAPMAKVLKPGGALLLVWPGPEHLLELRELIYDEVRQRSYDPQVELGELFVPERIETLNFRFRVDTPQALSDLLAMTPHGQRIKAAARERILAQPALECRADIRLGLFRRV